jgi:uncharacterized protein YdeI (YjbR/CyaY-like superfamily)
MPEITKTFYPKTRAEWRSWLSANYNKEQEIWLVYYRKETGEPRISYNVAVEEALCYGWIDSIEKSLDQERFVQRFTPRKPGSTLSPMNRERVRSLIRSGKMTAAGLKAIAHAFNPEKDLNEEKLVIPAAILKKLKANSKAWENFQKFPGDYQRIRIAYIESRKRHGMKQYDHALKHFIKQTASGKLIGIYR